MIRHISQKASDQLVALWNLGLSDRGIAEQMQISENAAVKRRQKLRLAANPAGGGRGSLTSARAENEEPWEAPKGMTKRRCDACYFWFSARNGTITRCPECVKRGLL